MIRLKFWVPMRADAMGSNLTYRTTRIKKVPLVLQLVLNQRSIMTKNVCLEVLDPFWLSKQLVSQVTSSAEAYSDNNHSVEKSQQHHKLTIIALKYFFCYSSTSCFTKKASIQKSTLSSEAIIILKSFVPKKIWEQHPIRCWPASQMSNGRLRSGPSLEQITKFVSLWQLPTWFSCSHVMMPHE